MPRVESPAPAARKPCPPAIYLHGLSSSAGSAKGAHLAAVFAARGHQLSLPDLNLPSFERLDVDAMLAAVTQAADAIAPGGEAVRLVGSSLGGWLAARWASINFARVDRMLLLCPAFHMQEHWPRILGAERVASWESRGEMLLPDHTGSPRPVHWGFVASHARHPTAPAPPCPTRVLHGRADPVVPVESSRRWTSAHPHLVTLRELEDDHALMASLAFVEAEIVDFFELGSP